MFGALSIGGSLVAAAKVGVVSQLIHANATKGVLGIFDLISYIHVVTRGFTLTI